MMRKILTLACRGSLGAALTCGLLACGDDGGGGGASGSATGTASGTATGTASGTATGTASGTGTATGMGTASGTATSTGTTTVGSSGTATMGGSDTGTSGGGDTGTATGMGTGASTGMGGGTTGGIELASWVLTVEDTAVGTHRLLRISIDPLDLGTVTEICPDITMPASIGQDTNFTALTFNKQQLYASVRKTSNGDTLVRVDPCDCSATEIGEYGYASVNGITSNLDEKMLGISSATDAILDIDVMSAMATILNMLPGDWGSHGLTWSDANTNVLYGIDATSDRLYTFDGDDGSSLGSVPLSMGFGSVGMEFHPGVQVLYACSNPGDLWSVDVVNGTVTVLADTNLTNCDNLAAPFGPVACIPQ